MKKENLKNTDEEIFNLTKKERKRRRTTLEMIPSENHTSPAVLEAMASILSDKYAEGLPGARYYGGNEYVDQVERLAQKRAKKIFNVPEVNVQPYSGSPANHAVYKATVEPGGKVMGMDLKSGGHLTHGASPSFSGGYYESFSYGVKKEDDLIDYDQVLKLAETEKPDLIWVGASAYPRDFNWEKFEKAADLANGVLAADIAHVAGLVAAGVHSDPAPHVDVITTTTHKTLRGPRGGMVMVTKKGLKKDNELSEKIDKAVFPGLQGGPHMHQIAAKAVCFKEILEGDFEDYGKQVVENNKALAEKLKSLGFNLITDGSDNHLCLIDLRNKGLGGKKAESLLDVAGITVNKNSIPRDPASASNPSGLRLGTPAITTRGMKPEEMEKIAEIIGEVLEFGKEKKAKAMREKVEKIAENYPIS